MLSLLGTSRQNLAPDWALPLLTSAAKPGSTQRPSTAENTRTNILLETTGCGVAFFDYDNDGWLDIFLVNGSRFEGFHSGQEPTVSRLFKNNRDGTFTDVTVKAGLAALGLGPGLSASATTTMTAVTICSSPTGARTLSIEQWQRQRSPM